MSDSFAEPTLTSTPFPKKRARKRKHDVTGPSESLSVSDVVGPRLASPRPMFMVKAKWSTSEKKQLISALRACHSEEELEKVYNMVPSRTRKEVAAEVLRLRHSVVQQGPGLQTPIETWLDFAIEMVHYEEEDLSRSMARAMSIVSNYEGFPPPEDAMSPNYKQLYKYLTAVLNGDEPPKLSPLDSAVMLDLMHSLTDVLSTTDTRLQRQVMKWKFSMLNCKVDINNLQDSAARTRRALSNVFPDDFNISSQKNESASTVPGPVQQNLATTAIGQREATHGPSDTISEPPKRQREATPGPSDTISEPKRQREATPGPSDTISEPKRQREATPGPSEAVSEPPKKGPGRVRKGEPPLEKPQLYSLNPFCVPVEVLKLRSKKRLQKSSHVPL
ncbi:uncharacterized protein LOC124148323 isoform X2 [Haliotis rufescens]|uniref:uncharacterized protein LOC124148323 isoform X2 n=1 Tax=Haliotis rufescens TaxID=6454 RepID=UPI00201EA2FA|nr:uncharacterized protein LOC124148323 isoform X2 [Haliotis rufescens]